MRVLLFLAALVALLGGPRHATTLEDLSARVVHLQESDGAGAGFFIAPRQSYLVTSVHGANRAKAAVE